MLVIMLMVDLEGGSPERTDRQIADHGSRRSVCLLRTSVRKFGYTFRCHVFYGYIVDLLLLLLLLLLLVQQRLLRLFLELFNVPDEALVGEEIAAGELG